MKNDICINEQALRSYLESKSLDSAIFDEIKALAGRTIAEIVEIIRNGKAREHFRIHDVLNLFGYELEVIGIGHDMAADNLDRPTITLMAKSLLHARRMHPGACQRGWIDTELRKWLNTEFITQLPEELTQHICEVVKLTHNSKGEAFETVDKLFIPAESELFGSAIWSAQEDGPRYEAFATSDDRMRFDEDGDGCWYWTRSAGGGDSTYCALVASGGLASAGGASSAAVRAPLCFCLA